MSVQPARLRMHIHIGKRVRKNPDAALPMPRGSRAAAAEVTHAEITDADITHADIIGQSAADDAIAQQPARTGPLQGVAVRQRDSGIRLRHLLQRLWGHVIDRLIAHYVAMRHRRLLARLDDWALRDMGIDRAQAEDESSASFWRLR